MSKLVRDASRSELPLVGEAKEYRVGEKVVCIANIGGRLAAMDNVCLHRGGSLGQGTVEHGKVVCPWHGWQWDPITGAAQENAALKLVIFPIKVEGDDVWVEL